MHNVIICSGGNGRCVVFGESENEPVIGEPITLHNARMVLYWSAPCGGLFGLAAKGPQEGTKLTHAVDKTATEQVRQWLSVPDNVAEEFRSWEAS